MQYIENSWLYKYTEYLKENNSITIIILETYCSETQIRGKKYNVYLNRSHCLIKTFKSSF